MSESLTLDTFSIFLGISAWVFNFYWWMDMASSPAFSGHFPNNFKLVSFVCVISPPICFLRFLSFFFIFVSSSLPLFAFVSSWVFQLLRASISCLPYEVLLLFPSCLNTWSLLASYVCHMRFWFLACLVVYGCFCVLLLTGCSQISLLFALFVVFPLISWSTKKHTRGKFYFFCSIFLHASLLFFFWTWYFWCC